MGFVESLKGLIYDILHNLDRINVDYITSNGLNPLRIRHDSGGLIEFKSDGKAYYNGTEIVSSSGEVSDHGALTGLSDDDHSQYYNSVRHTKAVHDALKIDADTLDGYHETSFMRTSGANVMSGDLNMGGFDVLRANGIYAELSDTLWIGAQIGASSYQAQLEVTENGTKLLNNNINANSLQIDQCAGVNTPTTGDLNFKYTLTPTSWSTIATLNGDGMKMYDGLNFNTHPLTNVTGIYSNDSATSYTRFYNVNAGNTLKFEIDKSYNTSHQILDMKNNDIIHAYSVGGRTDAELVIASKYRALGLTAEAGYQIDAFRELDLNSNKIVGLATPTAGTDASTKAYADTKLGATATAANSDKLDTYHESSFFRKGIAHSNHLQLGSGYGIYYGADSFVVVQSNGQCLLKTDAYVYGNMSALSITDRTPFYEGDAIAEIMNIKGKDGEIDHATLPKFVQKKIKKEGKNEEQDERDIGAMISMLTVAVQQLTKRIESLEGANRL